MDYKQAQEAMAALSEIAKKHKITIVTATQPQRPDNGYTPRPMRREGPDIIIVDHFDLIRPDIYRDEKPKDI